MDTIALNASVAMWIVGKVATVREGIEPARELLLGERCGRKSRRRGNFIVHEPEIFRDRRGARAVWWARDQRGICGAPAHAAAIWARGVSGGGVATVLIGRDTRGSGVALEAAVVRGLRAGGAEPISLGVLPTPAVARAVRESAARLGW